MWRVHLSVQNPELGNMGGKKEQSEPQQINFPFLDSGYNVTIPRAESTATLKVVLPLCDGVYPQTVNQISPSSITLLPVQYLVIALRKKQPIQHGIKQECSKTTSPANPEEGHLECSSWLVEHKRAQLLWETGACLTQLTYSQPKVT